MDMKAPILMRDLVKREATKDIPIASVSNSARIIDPTPKSITTMAESLKEVGQLTPIIVHAVTRNTYRIVCGQTRFSAASKLGWTRIRADVILGSPEDYRIIELAENVERHDLTAPQRKEYRAKLKQMLHERFVAIKTAAGGRGNKGGVREAARQAGLPRSTVQREVKKVAQNTDVGPVSDAESPQPSGPVTSSPAPAAAPSKPKSQASDLMLNPLTFRVTALERGRIERFNRERCGNGTLAECLKGLIREGLQRHGYWNEKAGNGSAGAGKAEQASH